jgi:hypothetical protein
LFRADTAEGAESIRANGTSQVQEIRARPVEAAAAWWSRSGVGCRSTTSRACGKTSSSRARGLPHDAARETVEAVAEALDELRGVRPTWLSVAELLSYDWDADVDRDGWLNLSEYAELRARGFAGAIPYSLAELQADGEDYAYLEAAEADMLLSADPDLAESNFAAAESFVHAKWREPARQSMEGSVAAFLEFVHAVVEPLGDLNDVRIIFLV